MFLDFLFEKLKAFPEKQSDLSGLQSKTGKFYVEPVHNRNCFLLSKQRKSEKTIEKADSYTLYFLLLPVEKKFKNKLYMHLNKIVLERKKK